MVRIPNCISRKNSEEKEEYITQLYNSEKELVSTKILWLEDWCSVLYKNNWELKYIQFLNGNIYFMFQSEI